MNRRSLFINIFFDFVALFVALGLILWIKPGDSLSYFPKYNIPLIVFISLWILISLVSKKYSAPQRLKLSRAFIYIIIVNLFITGIITLLMFLFQSQNYSRLIVFGTIGVAAIIELFFVFCDYYICNTRIGKDTSKVFEN